MQNTSVGNSIRSLAPNLIHCMSEKFSTFSVTWLASVWIWRAVSEQLYAASLLQELTSVIMVPSSSESKSATAEIYAPDQQFPSVKGRHLHFGVGANCSQTTKERKERKKKKKNRRRIKEALRPICRIDQNYDFKNFINPFIALIILELDNYQPSWPWHNLRFSSPHSVPKLWDRVKDLMFCWRYHPSD